jgi:23S rRNA pseudouridine955/2504/2580 synthase
MSKFAEKPVIVEISDERAGQRIDNYLMTQLKGVPKSHIYRLLRKGEVRVNKGRIKPDYRLLSGDLVRIPPVRITTSSEPAQPSETSLARIKASILYETPQLFVINKPSGMAVHGGSGIQYGVIEAIRALFPAETSLELVHRLDRDTSGCLLIARKRAALKALHDQLRNNQLHKVYVTLVKGQWQGGKQTVDLPLLKNTLKSGERIVRIDKDGKPAQSIFKPIKRFADASLMEVELITGRTHQIRTHAAHIGYPIAGDDKYGQRGFNLTMKTRGLNRLFLHAKSIAFVSPETQTRINVVAPLGKDLENVIAQCEEVKTAAGEDC